MKYEDIVQMAVTMTEMDTGVSLNTVEKQEMIDRILKRVAETNQVYNKNMKKFIRKEKTNNILLRFIGNICGSIFTFFLLKEIRADDKRHALRARMFAKISSLFEKGQDKWATYYI